MRAFCLHCATIAVLAGSVPNIVWAGSEGRRNTALAATAVAAGAWSNGTGKAGRRNTAILATAGAAVAWGRYADKRKVEKRRTTRRVVVKSRPVVRETVVVHRPVERERVVVHRPAPREVVYVTDHCCKHKHKKGCGHHKHKGHGRGLGHCKHDD